MNYQDTLLWTKTLMPINDQHEPLRARLRESYESSRENTKEILDQIISDFPNLTLHDISHIDSLWQTASIIIGRENYPISPMEGYILGCSFLLHDAALCYNAYGGISALRSTLEWKDYYSDFKENKLKSEDENKHDADFVTIRLLHAKQASQLLDNQFNKGGAPTYIIEDSELRNHWKVLIGDIATSHHWDIENVCNKLPRQINTMAGFPTEWRINPQKLACILRCADAAHIDSGRAPDYLFSLLKINGVSYDHWKAQNYLGQIDRFEGDSSKLLITSTRNFKEEDFAAWNVAYDAISVLDKEIKTSNHLFDSFKAENLHFSAKEIIGAHSRRELKEHIRTEGWSPCEANIHVSNIAKLIENLGGSKLYGQDDHILIVLRELIQNARDAIKARCYLEDGFSNGRVDISVHKDGSDIWINVSDNGTGMAEKTITTSFLDFGTSFWTSDLAKQELPGLRSSSFKSAGQFGIGFYAIFMVASEVIVTSRRYDKGLNDAITLKFPHGLTLTPILSRTHDNRYFSMSTSTVIRFKIDENKYKWTDNYLIKRNLSGSTNFEIPFKNTLCALCAGLDVNVYYQDSITIPPWRVHQNIEAIDFDKLQWLKDISFAEYQEDINLIKDIELNADRLNFIKENGRIVGLAAINTILNDSQNFLAVNTIGGLCAQIHARNSYNYLGYMESNAESAKRSETKGFIASEATLQGWAVKQRELLFAKGISSIDSYKLAFVLCNYKVDPIDLACAFCITHEGGFVFLPIDKIITEIQEGKRIIFIEAKMSREYMETNLDYSKVAPLLSPRDLCIRPIGRGNFLNLKTDNGIPINDYSLLDCIYRQANRRNCGLTFSRIPNFIESMFYNKDDAITISL